MRKPECYGWAADRCCETVKEKNRSWNSVQLFVKPACRRDFM